MAGGKKRGGIEGEMADNVAQNTAWRGYKRQQDVYCDKFQGTSDSEKRANTNCILNRTEFLYRQRTLKRIMQLVI